MIGGDCTVELGTVAGALRDTTSVGVVYIDLDTDLNTPESTGFAPIGSPSKVLPSRATLTMLIRASMVEAKSQQKTLP